jgi:hypothetical protein
MKNVLPFLLLVCSALPLRAQTEFQPPPKDSRVKLFDFPGGTPTEFLQKVKEVYGFDDLAVMLVDKTEGEALPPVKAHRSDWEDALDLLRKNDPGNQVDYRREVGWLEITFYKRPSAPEQAPAKEEVEAAVEQRPFRFPGGSAGELIAALSAFSGTDLAAITTIHPAIASETFPSINLTALDIDGILEVINNLSEDSGYSLGDWSCELDASWGRYILATPKYSDQNPSPALRALLAEGAGSALEMRKLTAAVKEAESRAAAAQTKAAALEAQIAALTAQLSELKSKIPQ